MLFDRDVAAMSLVVERVQSFHGVLKTPTKRTSVGKVMSYQRPAISRRSITFDRGSEFICRIAGKIWYTKLFCDPSSLAKKERLKLPIRRGRRWLPNESRYMSATDRHQE